LTCGALGDSVAQESMNRGNEQGVEPRHDGGLPAPQARAFVHGLAVALNVAVGGLAPAAAPMPGAPEVDVEVAAEHELVSEWALGRGAGQVRVPRPGGAGHLTVDRDGTGTHRIFAAGCCTTVISGDATRLTCVPDPEAPTAVWERVLSGHNLALAAVLAGSEVLNGSAVVLDGEAIVLVGPRGVGKTSVAAHLVARGADLLSDDVVGLGPAGGLAVEAHPGPALLHVRAGEAARLGGGRLAFAGPEGEPGVRRARAPHAAASVPVRAVCFLERSDDVPTFAVERVRDQSRLLRASFNLTLSSSDRLRRHYEVRSALAAGGTMRRVRVPAGLSARETAERLSDALSR
jgi:hypothetical protein